MSYVPRVLAIIPNPKDATSLYRGMGPLSDLQRSGVNIMLGSTIAWDEMWMADIVFMQRPYRPQDVQIAQIAHMNRVPIWVDYDDDLLNVPPENPTAPVYGRPDIHKNILMILELADVCSCSTLQLAKSLEASMVAAKTRRIPEFRVAANALNLRRWPHRMRAEAMKEPEQKLILWRGSETHVKDVLKYTPEIIEVAKKHPDWVWMFVGMNPWMLHEHMPKGRCFHQPPKDPIEYMDLIQQLRPALIHVPLVDNEFNRAKSNIAWIEGTWAGAQCVAPDWQEWQKPGVMTYSNNPGSFAEALSKAIETPQEIRRNLVEMSWKFIEEDLSLRHVNRLRRRIIDDFIQN